MGLLFEEFSSTCKSSFYIQLDVHGGLLQPQAIPPIFCTVVTYIKRKKCSMGTDSQLSEQYKSSI